MQRPAKLPPRRFRARAVVAVGLVDGQKVGQLEDALLDALQFVPRPGQQQDEETINHAADEHLALAHAHGLDQHDIEAGGLAEHDRLAGAPGHAAKLATARRRTDERLRPARQGFHAGLVPEDAAVRHRAARVHGEHGHTPAGVAELHAERIDEGALARARGAGYAHAHGPAGLGGKQVQQFIGGGAVRRGAALDERDAARQRTPVANPNGSGEGPGLVHAAPPDRPAMGRGRGLAGHDLGREFLTGIRRHPVGS